MPGLLPEAINIAGPSLWVSVIVLPFRDDWCRVGGKKVKEVREKRRKGGGGRRKGEGGREVG